MTTDAAPGLVPLATTCTWPTAYGACGADWPTGVSEEEQPAYEQMATNLLWEWTLRQFGVCTTTIRPCRGECLTRASSFWGRGPFPWLEKGASGWVPIMLEGKWYNVYCGGCGLSTCNCGNKNAIVLPGPVSTIESVIIDGTEVDPGTYRVDDHRLLVRTDGTDWPNCQDLDRPLATEPPVDPDHPFTWAITYGRGTPVPLNGQVAAGRLAIELAKAACGDSSCGLPKRVQTVSRQGVTIALLDSFDDVDKGRTGIWLIDSWVASVTMPVKQGGFVYSVDTMRRSANRRTTWP